MTIDEIRKITEENEDKPDRWYDIFINEYILPAAKKGKRYTKVKTILPQHIEKLKTEGYTLNFHGPVFEHTYDGIASVPGTEYWEIEW